MSDRTPQDWHRRQAVHLAGMLPDNREDALIVLRFAMQFVNDFLFDQQQPVKEGKVLTLVKDGASQ